MATSWNRLPDAAGTAEPNLSRITMLSLVATLATLLSCLGSWVWFALETHARVEARRRVLVGGGEIAVLDGGLPVVDLWSAATTAPYESIRLSRIDTWGTEPAYRVVFHRSGTARLTAFRNMPLEGDYFGTIDSPSYMRLCLLMDRMRFMDLADDYLGNWSDDATCTVAVTTPVGEKVVVDYGAIGPTELWAVEECIDSIRQKIDWKARE